MESRPWQSAGWPGTNPAPRCIEWESFALSGCRRISRGICWVSANPWMGWSVFAGGWIHSMASRRRERGDTAGCGLKAVNILISVKRSSKTMNEYWTRPVSVLLAHLVSREPDYARDLSREIERQLDN